MSECFPQTTPPRLFAVFWRKNEDAESGERRPMVECGRGRRSFALLTAISCSAGLKTVGNVFGDYVASWKELLSQRTFSRDLEPFIYNGW